MPYQANIPQATDQISVSQVDLLNNFQAIFNSFNLTADHEALDGALPGKHKWIHFTQQAVPPAFGANEFALYNQTAPAGLFFHNYVTNANYNLTSAFPQPGGRAVTLPSGIKILFGGPFAGSNVVDITINFPDVIAHVYSVVLTPNNGAGFPQYYATLVNTNIGAQTLTVGTYNYAGTARANGSFNYMLIGD